MRAEGDAVAEPTEETLRGPRIVLASVGVEAAEALEPAYNGDQRFGAWSDAPAALALSRPSARPRPLRS